MSSRALQVVCHKDDDTTDLKSFKWFFAATRACSLPQRQQIVSSKAAARRIIRFLGKNLFICLFNVFSKNIMFQTKGGATDHTCITRIFPAPPSDSFSRGVIRRCKPHASLMSRRVNWDLNCFQFGATGYAQNKIWRPMIWNNYKLRALVG